MVAILAWLGSPAPAAAHDELNYSAAACVPVNGAQWEGNGAKGFKFDSTVGGWFNYDEGDAQYLVCPVPYFRDFFNLEKILAKVHVLDQHFDAYTQVSLCSQTAAALPTCVTKDNFPTTTGYSTIELSLTPGLLTQFVWLRVRIPANAETGDVWSVNGTSGMIGYWILRQ